MSKSSGKRSNFDSILGWSSPFELICKLDRELERIDNSKILDELVDHTMNFALTAYHMTDWVWKLLERKPIDDWERQSWIVAIGHEPQKEYEIRRWALQEVDPNRWTAWRRLLGGIP